METDVGTFLIQRSLKVLILRRSSAFLGKSYLLRLARVVHCPTQRRIWIVDIIAACTALVSRTEALDTIANYTAQCKHGRLSRAAQRLQLGAG